MEKRHKKMEAELPLSLIESNILPRLPAKSVGRCMCVCKQWKSFLSTPTFARMHLQHVTINDYKLLQLDGSTTIRSNVPDPSVGFILATLDGLVCLASREEPTKLALWNPLTGAYKKLSSRPGFRFSLYDAFGFYIDSSGDYKLLHLGTGVHCGAHIYSLRLDLWREINFSVGSNIACNWSPATFYGQCLYFNVTYSSNGYRWIICFDVETETFKKKQFPQAPEGATNYYGTLVLLNGCIQLCVSYTIEGIYHVLLRQTRWTMDDGDGWVKAARSKGVVLENNEFTRQAGICITSSSGNWLAVLEETDSFRKMNTEDFTSQYWYFCSPDDWAYIATRMIYVETLVSPNP